MNYLDIIIIIPVLTGLVFGISKGIIKEVASLVSIIVGILLARALSAVVGMWLVAAFEMSPAVASPLAFAIIFLAFMVIVMLISSLLNKLIKALTLGWANRLLGGLFGAVKWVLLVSIILNVFQLINQHLTIVKQAEINKSFLYKPTLNFAPKLWEEVKSKS